MKLYERNINISISKSGEDTIITEVSFLDLTHYIIMTLTVNISSKEILDANAQMVKAPYKMCRETLDKTKSIIGLKIERGIVKRLAELIGGSSGCTHLLELATAGVRATSNHIIGFTSPDKDDWQEKRISDEEFIARTMPLLKDSCLPYKVSN